jgi:two-component system, sensor histidine kinase and response regulator
MIATSRTYMVKFLSIVTVWLVVVLGLAAMVGQRLVADTRQYVLKTLDHQTQSYINDLEDGLQHQILLTRILANDSKTRVFAAHPTAALAKESNEKLEEFTAKQPVSICYLMDQAGRVIASSNYNTPQSFVGHDYSFRSYFKDALVGSIGISLHVGASTGKRGVFIACPVRVDDTVVGVLVTKDELSAFEERLKEAQALILLADSSGVIVVSSRPQWEGLTIDPTNPEQRVALQDGQRYGGYPLDWSGMRLSHDSARAYIHSHEYFFKARQLANVDWQLLAFAETYQVQQTRYMAVALGALLAIAIGGALLWIHQNRRFQRRLAQSERLYRGLYEASADAFLLVDQEDGIVDCNDMALRLFGLKNQESLRHKLLHELAPAFQSNGEESREVEIRLVAHATTRGSGRFEWTLCRNDGTLIPTEILLTRVDIDGKPILQVVMRDISERKRMEDALRRSEERYRTIFENLLDGYYRIDMHGTLLFANEKLADILGYSADEIVGKDMVAGLYHDPEEMPKIMDAIREAGGRLLDYELVLKRKDGSEMVFSSNMQVFHEEDGGVAGLEGVLRDITPRKRLEAELRLAKTRAELDSARLASIISVMEEGVVFADAMDRIVEVNDYFCNFVGKRPHEVLQSSIWEICQGELAELLRGVVKEYREDSRRSPAFMDTSIDALVVRVRTQAIFRGGQYNGVLINLVDITSLVEARIKAELASRAKSEFIANMSHEVRTPMHAIIGLSQILGESLLTNEQRECLQMIQASADHLLNTINAVLDFSRIEADKLELDSVPFELESTVRNVLGTAAVRAQEKNLAFDFQCAPEVPVELVGDPIRLRQVLFNLLDNAIKFTHDGHIGVTIGLQEIGTESAFLEFSVADTGIGIPSDMLGAVFESFTQVDSSITRRFGGTGLGLAISRRLVESMGGHIWVESEPGKGSCFRFTARFALPDSLIPTPQEPPSVEPCVILPPHDRIADSAGPGLRLLLAEDNLVNQRLAARVLEKHGHQVTVVANGLEALMALENNHFDLILMDLQMPDLDGMETTRVIREHESGSGRHIPIIALTAHALQGDRERCFDAGMDDYISKPIKMDELLRAVDRWTIRLLTG